MWCGRSNGVRNGYYLGLGLVGGGGIGIIWNIGNNYLRPTTDEKIWSVKTILFS